MLNHPGPLPFTTAMVLCAGRGTRMEELSATCPKPLLPVWGQPMLGHLLTHMQQAGITHVVVNVHHLANQVVAYLEKWRRVFSRLDISHENTLLGVGGGIRHALPLLGEKPFFVLNGDLLFNPQTPFALLQDIAQKWTQSPSNKGACLGLVPHAHAWGYEGAGDFSTDAQATLAFRSSQEAQAPYVYAGVQLLDPALFHNTQPSSSLKPVWEMAQQKGQFKGVVWPGEWFHVGTKSAYTAIENAVTL